MPKRAFLRIPSLSSSRSPCLVIADIQLRSSTSAAPIPGQPGVALLNTGPGDGFFNSGQVTVTRAGVK
jgi:hypothetical protein